MVLTADVWCADAFTALTLRCDLLEQVTKQFAAEGIAIPYPSTIRILGDPRLAPAAPEFHRP
jgi:small-conductance mechanosensitive channel